MASKRADTYRPEDEAAARLDSLDSERSPT